MLLVRQLFRFGVTDEQRRTEIEKQLTGFQLPGEGEEFAVLGFQVVADLQQDE